MKTYSVTVTVTYQMEVEAETPEEAENCVLEAVDLNGADILHEEIETEEVGEA